MEKSNVFIGLLLGAALLSAGCIHAISKDLRAQIDETISVDQVRNNPDAYKGRMVLWGGVIVQAKNLKEGTLIEVVQKPVDLEGRPRKVDQSDGRFLSLFNGFLDSAIYSEGREIIVAGTIREVKVRPLGEILYSYPLVSVSELHLWREPETKERGYYYPAWYYPYWYRYGSWYY